jgi:exodeoxyribonuclease X
MVLFRRNSERFPDVDQIIFLDFETTGLKNGYQAVSVAWFEVNRNLDVIDQVSQLINPRISIEPGASAVHGIYNEDVADEPTLKEFIVDVLGDPFRNIRLAVAGHNVGYDLRIFNEFYYPAITLCTLAVARRMFPHLEDHRLTTVAQYIGLDTESAHNSQVDAALSLEVARHAVEVSHKAEQPIAQGGDRFTDLVELATTVPRDSVMTFGKYKGIPIRQLPPDYVAWLRQTLDGPEHVGLLRALRE